MEKIGFSNWGRFIHRDRIKNDPDVPDDFGILGVYLLASPLPVNPSLFHLAPEVVYIGMSKHITQRLEKSHSAVRNYKSRSGDVECEKLFYTEWYSPWSSRNKNRSSRNKNKYLLNVQIAFVKYIERKLIWEYANKHQKLPNLNKC